MKRTSIHLAADLAAIDGSFGTLAEEEDTFARGRDERMDYLDRLAGTSFPA